MDVAFVYRDGITYLSATCFNTLEKVSRRTWKKQDKNKREPQLKERQMFHRELASVREHTMRVMNRWIVMQASRQKKEGERKQRALEVGLLVSGERKF